MLGADIYFFHKRQEFPSPKRKKPKYFILCLPPGGSHKNLKKGGTAMRLKLDGITDQRPWRPWRRSPAMNSFPKSTLPPTGPPLPIGCARPSPSRLLSRSYDRTAGTTERLSWSWRPGTRPPSWRNWSKTSTPWDHRGIGGTGRETFAHGLYKLNSNRRRLFRLKRA